MLNPLWLSQVGYAAGHQDQARQNFVALPVDGFHHLCCPLVLAGPRGFVLAPGRRFQGQAVDQGEEATGALLQPDPEIELVIPLEVGLEEIPAIG